MPVVISGILRLLSAGTSTASKPTPRRATTIMPGAASSSAWRNSVPPRVTALASLSLGCSDGTCRRSGSRSRRRHASSARRCRPAACGRRSAPSSSSSPVVIRSPCSFRRTASILETGGVQGQHRQREAAHRVDGHGISRRDRGDALDLLDLADRAAAHGHDPSDGALQRDLAGSAATTSPRSGVSRRRR